MAGGGAGLEEKVQNEAIAIEQGRQPPAPSSGTASVVTLHCADASVCL